MPQQVRIASVLGQVLRIPALDATSSEPLVLGYLDDDYGDNGYWGHDDGTENQCRGVGPAWVALTINRGPRVTGAVHLEQIGTVGLQDGEFAGTRGMSRRLEGFSLRLLNPVPGLSLRYMAHLEKIATLPSSTRAVSLELRARLAGWKALRLSWSDRRRPNSTSATWPTSSASGIRLGSKMALFAAPGVNLSGSRASQ
jgi:hypothetical protein